MESGTWPGPCEVLKQLGAGEIGLFVAMALLPACAPPLDTASAEREVEQFLATYAADLRAHDRDAIVNRYDPRGVFTLVDGRSEFRSVEDLRSAYGAAWQGPAAFRWHDITTEVVSPDALMVVARFEFTPADSVEPLWFSYTALLVRQDGTWRIRLEYEVPEGT